jgi:hypothetical protein
MTCPACNGNKFEKIGNSVYCLNYINGRLCGVTLKGKLRREYFAKHASKKDRNNYWNKYYYRKKRKYRDGITLSEIAVLKFCTVRAVEFVKNKFDILQSKKPIIVKFNNKVTDWNPKRYQRKGRNNDQH